MAYESSASTAETEESTTIDEYRDRINGFAGMLCQARRDIERAVRALHGPQLKEAVGDNAKSGTANIRSALDHLDSEVSQLCASTRRLVSADRAQRIG